MTTRRRNPRTAFTLIELVASAVLTAMMMAGLLGVVWSAVRDTNQLRQSETSQFPATLLIDQMRTDFLNARGMAIDSSGLTLHGFLGRDPKTRQPSMTPGTVRYEIRRAIGRGVLMRSTSTDSGEPVWFGLSALRIEPLSESDPEDELLPEPETGGLPEVPLSFRITMVGNQGQILWREVIHHHES
jgi:type II secretory pathway pseudopilin PulG